MQEQQMDDERRDDERMDDERYDDEHRDDAAEGQASAEGRMATATAEDRPGIDREPADERESADERETAVDHEPAVDHETAVDHEPAIDRESAVEREPAVDREPAIGREPAGEEPLDLEGYRTRWDSVQASFVDDPRAAAEQADEVVSELLHRLQERRERLHAELDSGDTETMRQAIRQYRDLFHALARE